MWLLSLLSVFRVYEFVCVEGIFVWLTVPLWSIFRPAADLTAPFSANGTENLDILFPDSLQTRTLFSNNYQSVRGKWDMPNSLCGMFGHCSIGPLWILHILRSLCPCSLHCRWTELCANGPANFISEAEVRVWGHLACWMPSYNSSALDIHYTHRWAHAHCMLFACLHRLTRWWMHCWFTQITNL